MSSPAICEGNPAFLSDKPDVERLYDNIQVMIPGLTTDMTTLVIWNTIEDFFQRSTIRREHVYWHMAPGVVRLQFDPYDKDWRVFRFLGYQGPNNVKLTPPGELLDLTHPTPDNDRNGEVILGLKPRNLQVQLPYNIWTLWFETLLAGACYRLYMQPAKPYTDVNMARLQASMYRAGIASARALVQSGNVTDGAPSWRFPYFAAGGHADGSRRG